MSQNRYDCQFNVCSNDSLQILVRDQKSKRQFSNLFTKSKLLEMNLGYSVNELANILDTAKDAKSKNLKNWKFLIKYKSNSSIINDAEALTAQNTLFSYKTGDKMIILVNICEPKFELNAVFLLRQSISPLQSTTKKAKNPFSYTYASKNNDNYINSYSKRQRRQTAEGVQIKTRTRSQTLTSKRLQSQIPKPIKRKRNIKTHKYSHTPRRSMTRLSQMHIENEKDLKIAQLNKRIKRLERENRNLLNKTKQNKDNKLWLKQKIEKLQKDLDTKICKQIGINVKQFNINNNDLKRSINMPFNIIQKLVKLIKSKEVQYENISSKWINIKKENKQLKKTQNIKNAIIEKQKNIISAEDKKINQLEQNEKKYIQNKTKKMERKFINKQNKYKIEIKEINKRNAQLNVKVNNLLQESSELKRNFDKQQKFIENVQQTNNKLRNDINKLIYCINERNQKSFQLIECVKKTKHIINDLEVQKPNVNRNRLTVNL